MMSVSAAGERMLLSGGAVTRAYWDIALELSGTSQPTVVIDSAPVATSNGMKNIEKVRTSLIARGAMVGIMQESQAAFRDPGGKVELRSAVEALYDADILFVPGGDTTKLLDTWQHAERAPHVRALAVMGKLTVCGASAGSLLWFDTAFSDSKKYAVAPGRPWHYSRLHGLGFLPGWGNVHHSDRDNIGRYRRAYFENSYSKYEKSRPAIGLDTYAGLVISYGMLQAVDLRTEASPAGATASVHHYSPDGLRKQRILDKGRRLSVSTLK